MQYAVEHLGVELILVLGHSDCGAVKAAMEGIQSSNPLGALLGKIQPAVATASRSAGDPSDNVVIANIQLTLARLQKMEWPKKLMILGASYNLKSGLVTLNPGI